MGKKKVKERKPYEGEVGATRQDEKKAQKKTYSLSNENRASAQPEEGLFKVELSTEREAAILDLILESKVNRSLSGAASKRITTKKLKDFYTTLQKAGFKHTQIESAMGNTVQYGGDLIDALDWLCLNVNNDQLPEGFSEALTQEENNKKKRPKFKGHEATTGLTTTASNAGIVEEVKGLSEGNQATGTDEVEGHQPRKAVEEVKDWILRYAEQSDSENEDKLTDDNDSSQEKEEERNVNSKYLEMSAQLEDCKCRALEAKTQGDKSLNKQLTQRIRSLQEDLTQLESHPSFDKRSKTSIVNTTTNKDRSGDKKKAESYSNDSNNAQQIKDAHSSSSSSNAGGAGGRSHGGRAVGGRVPQQEQEEEEEEGDMLGCFALMEKQESQVTKATPQPANQQKQPLDRREFEYTRKQWTGKSPKQFLIDWVRKHLPKSPAPRYSKVHVRGNLWRSRCCVVQKEGADLEVCPDIVCENLKEAEHLASTLALYRLCKGQKVYQLLPPPYRVVWLEWQDAEDRQKEGQKEQENKPRDQFISRLMKKLTIAESLPEKEDEKDVAETQHEGVESWEDIDEKDLEESIVPQQGKQKTTSHNRPPPPPHVSASDLRDILKHHHSTEQHTRLLETREELPVYQYREAILSTIMRQDVVVIAAETGSGKSTQVPQLLLEELITSGVAAESSIICTEPRRISATSLASRVCDEMGGPGPGREASLCGYQIRFEVKKSRSTRLLYCTTGVLLRQLQQDPLLTDVACVIVDEVHERSVQSDFLLIILKEILRKRQNFKVVLMSATLDADKFSSYLHHCPVVSVPGRTFPVQVLHLEDALELTPDYTLEEDSPYAQRYDKVVEEQQSQVSVTGKKGEGYNVSLTWSKENYFSVDQSGLNTTEYSLKTRNIITRLNDVRINMDLIMAVLELIETWPDYQSIAGAVLIFLPGLAHIQELYERLSTESRFSNKHKYRIVPLHSILTSGEQNSAFTCPPKGVRKVVLATNIAETGITIPDVVFVIDTGKVKEKRYIETSQMSTLEEVYVSQASARQRQGRAGRVREGVCFRLYTQQKYESLRSFTVPELLRVPLEELCLHVMKCDLGEPADFLAGAVDPPKPLAVSRAMSILREVGACRYQDDASILTPLGCHLAALPVDVRIGKMLVYSAVLGCLEPVSVIAAAMSDKSPFVAPFGKRDAVNLVMSAVATANSDQLTLLKVYCGWQAAEKDGYKAGIQYCNKHFLKRDTLIDIRRVSSELVQMVKSIGFQPVDALSILRQSKATKSLLSTPTGVPQHLSLAMTAILKAVLTAGLYPQVAKITYDVPVDAAANVQQQEVCTGQTLQGPVAVHPASVNRFLVATGFLVYHEKVKGSRVYVRSSTLVRSYPLLLFGGDIEVHHKEKLVSLDKWIKFKAFAKTAVIFKELRLLLDNLLARKLASPSLDFQDENLVHQLLQLIVTER